MHPLALLAIGVTIVIGGILVFRLHAFLALILAALTVGALTPRSAIEGFELSVREVNVLEGGGPGELRVRLKPSVSAVVGSDILAMRLVEGQWREAARLPIVRFEEAPRGGEAVAAAVLATDALTQPLGPDDLLVQPADRAAAGNIAGWTVGRRVAETFGGACASIAILIAMASIIGKCLLESGAADKIVRTSIGVVGERGAPVAFVGSGFLLGIPVFFDTVFYLLMPLGKAMRLRTGRDYLLYVLTIVAGGTMAHSLVPPTPGPLFVAEALHVDLGVMILAGCLLGLITSSAGYVYAVILNRFWDLPLRDSADISVDELRKSAERDLSELPPLLPSLAPILLPVVLIGGLAVLKSLAASGAWSPGEATMRLAETLGDKNIALTISAAIAIGLLVWAKRASRKELSKAVGAALASGGVIILITAAGGSFGGVLKQTGIASLIGDLPSASASMIVLLGFFITTAIRTAQGSATVAMITAVGVLAPLAASGQLPCHPVYLALAIGCGSKPLAWMNDSGFWVICTMSGMTEAEGLKAVTPLSLLMGLAGLAALLVAVNYYPMV